MKLYTFDGKYLHHTLDYRPNNLGTSFYGHLLYHDKLPDDQGQNLRAFSCGCSTDCSRFEQPRRGEGRRHQMKNLLAADFEHGISSLAWWMVGEDGVRERERRPGSDLWRRRRRGTRLRRKKGARGWGRCDGMHAKRGSEDEGVRRLSDAWNRTHQKN